MVFSGQTGMGWGGQTETELEVKQTVFSTFTEITCIII
jgi:hypothetical protein